MYMGIDLISVNLYWNLSSGVLENCLWAVSKPDIRIWFHRRFVEGCGEGYSWAFLYATGMYEGVR